MDVLIAEPLSPEVRHWLQARHEVLYAPQLAQDAAQFRLTLARARAVIIPPSLGIDAATLNRAPHLVIVGRLSAGPESIDLEACARMGVEVVRPAVASAQAEAEFAVGALLQMLRRVPIVNDEGMLVGRELSGSQIGIVGMTPAAKPLAQLLSAFGARVVGYDPPLHLTDPLFARCGVAPVRLTELMRGSDGVAVLLHHFARYTGLFNHALLAEAKRHQVLVCLGHSALFDEHALAAALGPSGSLAAAWFDCLEPGLMDPGRPLRHRDTLQVTPRVASTTQGSRLRSAWAVARRIDELLSSAASRESLSPVLPAALAGPGSDPAPA
jgi:D-3-phosphoglycerate dehydrogenase / 2-oxoglutarate reductase